MREHHLLLAPSNDSGYELAIGDHPAYQAACPAYPPRIPLLGIHGQACRFRVCIVWSEYSLSLMGAH